MDKYKVTGMSCSACVSRVEKAAKSVSGVEGCSVNLLTNSMTVSGEYNAEELKDALNGAGYGAELIDEGSINALLSPKEKRKISPLAKRLIWSSGFLLILMYVSMLHNMLSFPLPGLIEDNYFLKGLIQGILALVVLIINKRFFINGVKSVIKGSPNMDTLVALGSGASFIYSVVILCIIGVSDRDTAMHLSHGLYFEAAAMIVTLITVGKLLEEYSKGKTTSALSELVSLQPRTALILENGATREISAEDIKKDQIFIVKAGHGIPNDGIIVEGEATVDFSALNGESIPKDVTVGDTVYAGTTSYTGYIVCKATTENKDTALRQIIKTVEEASNSKAPIARVADKVSGIFVPVVMGIALITIAVWLILGQEIGFALGRGISVLVISCPCALGLATPVAIMVGSGVGAKRGILFKNATALENTGKAKTVALDKTGTITKGEPTVTDIIPFGISKGELLSLAYSLESKSQHPLAKAIVNMAERENVPLLTSEDFKILSRGGVECKINGHRIVGGGYFLISETVKLPEMAKESFEALSNEGKTPLFFLDNGELCGIIAVSDEIKEDSADAISDLKKMGISVVMITGDNENSARAVANRVGIDKVISNVMPMDKEKVITDLKKSGMTVMVGDGINDAPALVSADMGMAIGQGTKIAIDSAEIVLMKNSLCDVVKAIKISRATLNIIYQNLFWAFVYNCLGIPLAAGVFISLLGWELSPMIGALFMSLSSFCVVTNALRLNFIKFERNKKMLFKKKIEGTALEVTGMMCAHCEAHVKKAVEAIEGVTEAIPDHKKNRVTVKGECDIEAVKNAIKELGYTVK